MSLGFGSGCSRGSWVGHRTCPCSLRGPVHSRIPCQVTGRNRCHSPVTLPHRPGSGLAPVSVSQEVSLPFCEVAGSPSHLSPHLQTLVPPGQPQPRPRQVGAWGRGAGRAPFPGSERCSGGPRLKRSLKPRGASPPTLQKQPHPSSPRRPLEVEPVVLRRPRDPERAAASASAGLGVGAGSGLCPG